MQMAVFLLNNCKFQGCGRAFPTLADLIHHIENSHIGSEFGDDEDLCSEDEDSDDSYTTQEEFTTELILGMMQNLKDGDVDKPFACPVPNCKKRYKNVNGMKYHARHGHRKDPRTAQKLRAHMIVHHSTTDLLKMSVQPSTASTTLSLQQVSTANQGMTNAIFSVSSSGTQSGLSSASVTQTSLSLVPVTVTTTKQGQITLASTGATLQLIGCPQAEMMKSEMKAE
ncbi:JAZF1-like protein [Mya arenaria]|uniref:JAZF1-like protein n=1 Tax=Mya arenaria TaxID=6604 RepID=A0ABY7E8P9_MYAAR|nr:JAZF1-like protein [Mya arenaria]